ncbi:hypothetical protein OAQ84_01320, partial [Bdellovibrionales bacterium]|nr:hypothetical protein [Bdellovibrionales bacterium]
MKNVINYTLLIVLAFSIVACGASKNSHQPNSTDLSSRGNPTTNDTGSSNNGIPHTGVLTECSGFDKDGLAGNLTTYYDPATGKFVETYIRMTITKALEAMSSDPNRYVQIFRWYIDESGSRQVSDNPTELYFIQRGTGEAINRKSPATYLSGSMISGLISKHTLSGITASNFYDNFIVVLGDIGLTYDAITVAVYDSAT